MKSSVLRHLSIGLLAILPLGMLGKGEVYGVFNPQKVILSSSQYTPGSPYQAQVWVYNTQQRYDSQYYNHVWATPPVDSNGRNWYDPEYITEGQSEWITAMAPFSSDEYYKDQKSYQWVTVEVMGEMYMRRSFTLDSPLDCTVYLSAGHDDAPSEWYINGVKVYSASDGWDNDAYVALSEEQKALIKTDGSENVLAVHVHQNWGGAFADCGLYGSDMYYVDNYLNTVEFGQWDCAYYILNYNEDISMAETGGWASVDEDESDWIKGYGPFSNDQNMFYVTEWPSQVRPILIRRHFNIDSEMLESIKNGELQLNCSYDENPKVYVNGTLIWSAEGWNDNNYAQYVLDEDDKALLVEGDNVLAVSLMQGGGGGHIDYGLSIVKEFGTSSMFTPIVNVSFPNTRIYDLSGRYVGDTVQGLDAGVYIINGKKYLIRK